MRLGNNVGRKIQHKIRYGETAQELENVGGDWVFWKTRNEIYWKISNEIAHKIWDKIN